MLVSPLEQDTKVDIADLTHASVEGNGVFDVLMRAVNAHLQKEWSANRLKGTEYSTVYLGALESTMNASLQFLLARDKTNAELDILKQQLVNLKVEEINAGKQGLLLDKQALDLIASTALKDQQRLNLIDDLLTNEQQRINLASENLGIISRTAISDQQTVNLIAENLNIPKQGNLLELQAVQLTAQTKLTETQKLQAQAETNNVPKQGVLLDLQALDVVAGTEAKQAEINNIYKQGDLIEAQTTVQRNQVNNLVEELLRIRAQIAQIKAETVIIEQKYTGRKQV